MTTPTTDNVLDRDLTLFVACYNEEKGIIPTLETVLAALKEVGCRYDIVIIDDASTDRSVKLIREFMDRNIELPITLYVNDVNQGLGANYAEAAFRGRGKYYRLICGDNVESKETLVSIFKHLGEADMIIPYPASNHGRPLPRRLISRLYTGLINLIGGFHIRYYNGLAIHLRYNVMRWHSNSHGFGFQADLIARLLDMGASHVEVPITQYERAGGTSKAFTLRNICSVGHSLLEIFIRRTAKLAYPARSKLLRTVHVYGAAAFLPGDAVSTIAEVNGKQASEYPSRARETPSESVEGSRSQT
jgi:glycosyltransferase involved in cell wall biosynthesis